MSSLRNGCLLAVGLVVLLGACRPSLSGPWPPVQAGVAEYRIGPGDLLRVAVFGNADLTSRVTVRPDGRISLPLIDEVVVAGRTTAEANREISDLYQRYVTAQNRISLVVEEVHSYRVYVLGKVNHPGEFPSVVPVTVLQALALAGGPLRTADVNRMVVLRRTAGRDTRFQVSYDDVMEGRTEENFLLSSGDTVIVP